MQNTQAATDHWLTRDAALLSFSAFFADLGYQGVTALFPLYLVIELRLPVYYYGLITALSFGVGSFFAWLGGKAGTRYNKKAVSLAGNLLIPLMSFSGLTHNIALSAALFVAGWWARYFRTPSRRALLALVSPPQHRSRIFGFLHALDIGGGLLSALVALGLIALGVPLGVIILCSVAPLLCSSLVLALVNGKEVYADASQPAPGRAGAAAQRASRQRSLFLSLLVAATLYGFSFYNLGFPILTVATLHQASYSALLGVLTYAVYLGVSAISGYALGAASTRPLRSLWLYGYLPSALGSLLIGLGSYALHLPALAAYVFVAVLGLGMGAAETFEPTLTSLLVSSADLAGGMGWLSVSRSIGQFASNLIMGLLFAFSPLIAYVYAFLASLAATAILFVADWRTRSAEQSHPESGAQRL